MNLEEIKIRDAVVMFDAFGVELSEFDTREILQRIKYAGMIDQMPVPEKYRENFLFFLMEMEDWKDDTVSDFEEAFALQLPLIIS